MRGLFIRIAMALRLARRLPFDRSPFKREKLADFGDRLTLVELSAADVVMLSDTLTEILRSDELTIEDKAHAILGLRLQALALSMRDQFGRIPYDAQSERDLRVLAVIPTDRAKQGLALLAEDTGCAWLNPDHEAPGPAANDEEDPPAALAESASVNP